MASNVIDNSFGTRWEPAEGDENATLTAEFTNKTKLDRMELRFEYPWKSYCFKVESSHNNQDWKPIADYTINGVSGSPVSIKINDSCDFIRISFEKWNEENKPSVWELRFF